MDSFVIKPTWANFIKSCDPSFPVEDMDFLLWEHTAFPFGDREYVENQIIEVINNLKLGKTWFDLDKERDEYITRELAKYREDI